MWFVLTWWLVCSVGVEGVLNTPNIPYEVMISEGDLNLGPCTLCARGAEISTIHVGDQCRQRVCSRTSKPWCTPSTKSTRNPQYTGTRFYLISYVTISVQIYVFIFSIKMFQLTAYISQNIYMVLKSYLLS